MGDKGCMSNPIFLAHVIDKISNERKEMVDDDVLTAGQRNLIMMAGWHEGSTQLELSRLTHLKPPTVCIAMQKMEQLGYVRREEDREDMRQIRIFLTEKGKQRNERITRAMHDTIELAKTGMTDKEWETLVQLMRRVCDNLMPDCCSCDCEKSEKKPRG